MFLATTAPRTPLAYGSFDLNLQSPAEESSKVDQLCARNRGAYNRPTVVVFYIPERMRKQAADELDRRFGYRTETIYPDLAGFALANGPRRELLKLAP